MTMPPVRVVLFARFPTPGRAKTRLLPVLDFEAAASLHARMVERMLATMRASGLPYEVQITGASPARFARWRGSDIPLVDQGDVDLGDRTGRVIPPAIISGADIPDLRADHLHAAVAAVAAGRASGVAARTRRSRPAGGSAALGVASRAAG
jgi:uncharacterized protein